MFAWGSMSWHKQLVESTIDHLFLILTLEDMHATCQLSRLLLKTLACIIHLSRIDSHTLVETSCPIMMTFVHLHCAELAADNRSLKVKGEIYHINPLLHVCGILIRLSYQNSNEYLDGLVQGLDQKPKHNITINKKIRWIKTIKAIVHPK